MNCTIYMVSYNFATHAICLLALTTYKYSELEMSFTTQKLSYKASCKTPFFFIVIWEDDIKCLLDFSIAKGRKIFDALPSLKLSPRVGLSFLECGNEET
jgi:hypothetical protein